MSEGRAACESEHPVLLAPKFLRPVPRDSYVRRNRLHECLSRASSTPVTLVSAPAGCGKTALVAAWLTDLPAERWTWLSLDSRDNDLMRFWSYLIKALRSVAEGVGEATLNELSRSGGKGPVERWLGSLLNDLVAIDLPTSYLVVDDLHVITDSEIRATVTLFAASMPSWLRLIIVTRADPPLPLPRLRAEGRLTEIRQVDLRFDTGDAETLLRAQGIDNLGEDQLQWLVDRTEGWAAGLQLAVIVLGDNPGPERLLQIAGSNRTFADYIVSEIVDVASEEMRGFLFTTSVLDRVNPSLARAVSGLENAPQILRDAQQRGLFIVALDEQGEWYRYHALFAETIQAEARSSAPESVQVANENAAKWFESREDLVMALDHWFAAGRPEEALRIAVTAAFQLFDTGQMQSIERITGLIPASVVGDDARRQLDYALLHHVIDAQVSRWWVDEAEKTIAALAVPDDQLTRRHQSVRAVCDLLFGEWDDAETDATAALDPRGIGEGDSEVARRSGLQLLRAKAWMELPRDAEDIFGLYLRHQRSSPAVREFYAPCIWALAAAIGGRIREAELWSAKATATAQELAVPPAPYLELLFARVVINRELGDNDSARLAIDELRSVNMVTYHSLRTMAEVELAMGFLSEDRVADAARVLDGVALTNPDIRLGPRINDAVDRAWTELHLATGDIVRARQTAQRMRIGFWRQATQAKVLLAEDEAQRAAAVLEALSPTSPRQQVTLGLLHAIAVAVKDPTSSQGMVEAALATASTEGMLQTVISAGPRIAELLESASWTVPGDWMDEIRRALAKGPRGPTTGRIPTLYEQPTERERTVARYLASRLTVPEIARELGISPNTLKTHISSLYRKMDVTSREAAVATARRTGVIG
jgi:LuxR family transcriptional regulator, maltose regulon positive regulatory protein